MFLELDSLGVDLKPDSFNEGYVASAVAVAAMHWGGGRCFDDTVHVVYVALGCCGNWKLLADSFEIADVVLPRCFVACACFDCTGFGSFEVVVLVTHFWYGACFDYIGID